MREWGVRRGKVPLWVGNCHGGWGQSCWGRSEELCRTRLRIVPLIGCLSINSRGLLVEGSPGCECRSSPGTPCSMINHSLQRLSVTPQPRAEGHGHCLRATPRLGRQ